MFKRAAMIREIKRKEQPWTRLKRGPDEEDEFFAETKRDPGAWRTLKKEAKDNISEERARTKKGRERQFLTFTDWARLKRGLGTWIKRGSEVGDDGWVRMM